MRYTKACLAGAIVIPLAMAIGCQNNDNNENGNGFSVANKTYTLVLNCSQTPTGSAAYCADANTTSQLQFTNMGGGNWQAANVPDSGYLAIGTFSGRTFTYTATSPTGFTEQGTLTFGSTGNAFSGSSTYVADSNAFTGECTMNGAIVPNIPPNAEAVGACP
jgi:hypothetical protein